MPKVQAKNETIAKHITHRPTGIKFGEDGTAIWPDDQFTKRRIKDGDVTVVEESAKGEEQPKQRSVRTSRVYTE